MSDPPERVWLVDDECGWQEARVEGNGVEYIRADHIVALEAEVERLQHLLKDANRRAEEATVKHLNTEMTLLAGRLQARVGELENALRFSLNQVSDEQAKVERLREALLRIIERYDDADAGTYDRPLDNAIEAARAALAGEGDDG